MGRVARPLLEISLTSVGKSAMGTFKPPLPCSFRRLFSGSSVPALLLFGGLGGPTLAIGASITPPSRGTSLQPIAVSRALVSLMLVSFATARTRNLRGLWSNASPPLSAPPLQGRLGLDLSLGAPFLPMLATKPPPARPVLSNGGLVWPIPTKNSGLSIGKGCGDPARPQVHLPPFLLTRMRMPVHHWSRGPTPPHSRPRNLRFRVWAVAAPRLAAPRVPARVAWVVSLLAALGGPVGEGMSAARSLDVGIHGSPGAFKPAITQLP